MNPGMKSRDMRPQPPPTALTSDPAGRDIQGTGQRGRRRRR